MTTSFFNGESTFPENNTTDQLVDALQQQLTASTADSQAAQAAAVSAAASASNAAIAEENVAGLSQAANDTLAQANDALTAANAAISSTAASATAAASSASAAAASATTSGTAAGQASVSETNAAASAASALASKNAAATSETNSAASATAANTSKVNAGTSETNAAASATSANTSKNAAATSASNAATSESNALSSKNAAATSAGNAATSEANALTSQNAAAASALVAQNFTASLAGKNRLINGDMRIAQRGSSVSIPTGTAAYGSCDRWKLTNTAGGTLTSEQVSLLDENGISRQFSRTTIAVVSTGISGVSQVQPFAQTLEGFNCFDLLGKQVTISFTLRASIAGTYAVSLYDSTGAASCVKSVVVSASNTPQRFAVTFPAIPSSAVIPAAATAGLNFAIGGLNTGTYQAPSLNTWVAGTYISAAGMTNWTATLNATLAVTDVQLEAGSVATPFERRSYGQELELCQRYYETGTVRVWGYADAGSGFGTTQPFKVSKRAAPTVAAVNSSAGNVSAAYAVLTGDTTGIVITHNATALGALAYVDTWTASAEL